MFVVDPVIFNSSSIIRRNLVLTMSHDQDVDRDCATRLYKAHLGLADPGRCFYLNMRIGLVIDNISLLGVPSAENGTTVPFPNGPADSCTYLSRTVHPRTVYAMTHEVCARCCP